MAELEHPYVIKLDGQLADDPAQFIHDNYGAALSWQRAEPHPDGEFVFRLVGFREWEGGSGTMWAYCIDQELQEPLAGKAAIRWWPDAPGLPEIAPPASAWEQSGIVAYVKETGAADWGIGRGESYYPETGSGVCKVWVCSPSGPSDLVENWGWLAGTAYRQLCPIFERVAIDGGNGEEPDGDLAEVVEQLERLADAAEEFVAWVKR